MRRSAVRRSDWPRTLAALATGASLGIATLAGGALLLYSGEGFLSSAGFLMAVALAALAAGLWVGAPGGPAGERRMAVRWMIAIAALALASFAATAWLRLPALQTAPLGPPLAMVLLLAEPAYALGALLSALERRRRSGPGPSPWASFAGDRIRGRWRRESRSDMGSVAVPALFGAAVGVALAASWLIPTLPPGPVFFGSALLLAGAGTTEMALWGDATEGSMTRAVVLITGVGGRGQVGYALAEAFARRGARLVLAGRTDEVEARARELGGDAVAIRTDLSTEQGAAAAVGAARERWGRLDTVVNGAGGLRVVKPVAEITPEEWAAEIDRNARTTFLVSRAALPLLRESRGSIVNFASPAAEKGIAKLGAYAAAKAGVVALTRTLALEEKASGVRVNAIAPGMIDTESNRADVTDPAARPWVSRAAIAEAVIYLAAAKAVTGEVLHVTNPDVRGRQNA